MEKLNILMIDDNINLIELVKEYFKNIKLYKKAIHKL